MPSATAEPVVVVTPDEEDGPEVVLVPDPRSRAQTGYVEITDKRHRNEQFAPSYPDARGDLQYDGERLNWIVLRPDIDRDLYDLDFAGEDVTKLMDKIPGTAIVHADCPGLGDARDPQPGTFRFVHRDCATYRTLSTLPDGFAEERVQGGRPKRR